MNRLLNTQVMEEVKPDGGGGGGGGVTPPTVAELQAQLAAEKAATALAQGDAAKYKKQRKALEAERDSWKKPNPDGSEKTYKELYETETKKIGSILERAKKSDISVALTDQLTQLGVGKDKLGAALKLVDTSLVEWTEDSGVDSTSAKAAAAKLKADFNFLFQGTLKGNDIRNPADGVSTTGEDEITMAELNRLTPVQLMAKQKLIGEGKLKLV